MPESTPRNFMLPTPVGGFSLMEILITVAIVSILATIAMPGYINYIERARRTDGYQALTTIIQAQERYFSNRYTYTTDLTNLGYSTASGWLTSKQHYRITASNCGAGTANAIGRCVLLTAAAQGGQVNDGDITLNSRGQKSFASFPYWPDR